jgi:hypothetical protein
MGVDTLGYIIPPLGYIIPPIDYIIPPLGYIVPPIIYIVPSLGYIIFELKSKSLPLSHHPIYYFHAARGVGDLDFLVCLIHPYCWGSVQMTKKLLPTQH